MEKQLPKNWVETSPLQISKIIRGVSYGKTDAFQVEFENSCLILRGGNIQDGEIVDGKDNVYVPLDLIKKEQFIQEHDVVIVGSTGSKNLIGKAATSLYNSDKISFGAFLMNIRASEPINKRYFSYYFQTNYYREAIRNLAGGVNINNIRKEYIENLYFPLPPLAEQNRIVAKLDSLFAQLESIKASMTKIPVLLKEFRQQVLMQAVTGKLTEEWRKGRTLHLIETLDDIENKRNRLLSKRDNKEIGFDNPTKILVPKEWKNVNLWDLSYVVTSGSRDWSKYYSDEGAFFVRSAEINNNKLRLAEAIKVNLPEKIEGKRSLIEKGNLLITITGANVGKCALIEEEIPESYVSQSVAIVKIVDSSISKYIHLALLSRNAEGSQLENMAYGMGRPVLSLPQIKSIKIPFPSLQEQQEIVSRVESLFAKADAIEQQYQSVKEKIDILPQALLHKAFKGELTEQLDSDGDARELLHQIQELKSQTTKSKKK